MATPALVGSIGSVSVVAAATVTPSFAQATTSGNLLIASVVGFANAAIATSSSGWNLAVNKNDATNVSAAAIFYKENGGASETAPTLTCAGASAMQAFLTEWSGAATSSSLDQTGNNTGFSATAITATASLTDTAIDDLVISVSSWIRSMATTITFTYGGTAATKLNDSGGSSRTQFLASGYNNGGATGVSADTGTMTASTGGNGAVAVIASFKATTLTVPRTYPIIAPSLAASQGGRI